MKKYIALVLLLFFSARLLASGQAYGEFTHESDTVHVEFLGKGQWDYDLSRKVIDGEVKVELTLPEMSDEAIRKAKNWKGGQVTKVTVGKAGTSGKTLLTFHVSDKNIQAFDYLTDDPPRLILDFYTDEEPQKKAAEKVSTPITPTKVATKLPGKRKPAATEFIKGKFKEDALAEKELEFRHGIFDGGDPDFTRFSIKDYEIREEAKIASQRNIYISFPQLRVERPHLKDLLNSPPLYEVVPQETDENKVARLLLTLFNKKRPAVFLKTLELFRKQFPKSKYSEIVDYMEADVYYDLWQKSKGNPEFEKAATLYRGLIEKYPDSPLVERTLLLLGYSYLEKGDSLGALMGLQRFLRYRPSSKYYDNVRLTIAEAYLTLKKPDDAINAYEEILAAPRSQKAAIDSQYSMGDVYFKQADYLKTIEAYNVATKKYPESAKDYPNAFYNKAESLFWLGRHKESLEGYRDFLRRFPAHQHCGFAMARLGELLEIFGADERRTLGAFLEGYFRNRGSEGAKISRARIISHRMKTMREKELASALKELNEIRDQSQLKEINEFITLMISDGFFGRAEHEKAIEPLIKFYQDNPTSPNLEVFKKRIVRAITERTKHLVETGNEVLALREFATYSDSWLKGDDRIDIKFHVARAHEKLSVDDEALSIYRGIVNKLYAIKGTDLEKERGVFESVPSTDSVNLRIANVAANKKDFGMAYDYIQKVKGIEALSPPEKVERTEIMAKIAESKSDYHSAIDQYKKLIDTWKGQPQQVAGIYLRLAKAQIHVKNLAAARDSLQKVINLAQDTQEVDKKVLADALQAQGDTLLSLKKNDEALTVYSLLLEKFESERSLEPVRYRLGKLLFDKGDLKGAENYWKPLQEDKTNVWGKLAKEQAKGKMFDDEYNRYINRIPAMEGRKKP